MALVTFKHLQVVRGSLRQMRQFSRTPAIVCPGVGTVGYGVVRSLGAAGIPLIMLGEHVSDAMYSRYCRAACVVPDLRDGGVGFIRALSELGHALGREGVLFMLNDVYVYLVSVYREFLKPYYVFAYLAEETLRACLDKPTMVSVAAGAGLSVPETWLPFTAHDSEVIGRQGVLPYVVKPRISRFAPSRGSVNRPGVFLQEFQAPAVRVETEAEFRVVLKRAHARGLQVCVQELISGPTTAMKEIYMVVDKAHEIIGWSTSRPIRQVPAEGGTCTYRESIIFPELLDPARRLVKRLGYHGICMMEFKHDSCRDADIFLEINPRFTQGAGFSTSCGVNLAALHYSELLSQVRPTMTLQKSSARRWVDFLEDYVAYFVRYRKQGDPQYAMSWRRWLGSLRVWASLEEAHWNWRDPWPGLRRFFGLARSTLMAPLRRRCRWLYHFKWWLGRTLRGQNPNVFRRLRFQILERRVTPSAVELAGGGEPTERISTQFVTSAERFEALMKPRLEDDDWMAYYRALGDIPRRFREGQMALFVFYDGALATISWIGPITATHEPPFPLELMHETSSRFVMSYGYTYPWFRNRGLRSYATPVLVKHAQRRYPDMASILVMIREDNVASMRVHCLKGGFRLIGSMTYWRWWAGAFSRYRPSSRDGLPGLPGVLEEGLQPAITDNRLSETQTYPRAETRP